MASSDSWIDSSFGVDIRVEKDRMIPMRDGTRLCADVYRPVEGEVPAILAMAPHNKELQTLDVASAVPPQPAWSAHWCGGAEAGDIPYFVGNGYALVVANARGAGKSEGDPTEMERPEDAYDLIEWTAERPWCTGKLGMTGISTFGGWQFLAAEANPPSLEAIFPHDPNGLDPFRDWFPGGVLHTFHLLISRFSVVHQIETVPELEGERRERWEAAMENPEYKQHPLVYNVLSAKGMIDPVFFEWFLDPYDSEERNRRVAERIERVNEAGIPAHLGSGWYAYTYKKHLLSNFRRNEHLTVPRKMLVTGFSHLDDPSTPSPRRSSDGTTTG